MGITSIAATGRWIAGAVHDAVVARSAIHVGAEVDRSAAAAAAQARDLSVFASGSCPRSSGWSKSRRWGYKHRRCTGCRRRNRLPHKQRRAAAGPSRCPGWGSTGLTPGTGFRPGYRCRPCSEAPPRWPPHRAALELPSHSVRSPLRRLHPGAPRSRPRCCRSRRRLHRRRHLHRQRLRHQRRLRRRRCCTAHRPRSGRIDCPSRSTRRPRPPRRRCLRPASRTESAKRSAFAV